MKAIIYYSLSGKTDRKVKALFEGDFYRLKGKIKIPKTYWIQLLYLGFFASFNAKLKYQPLDIDFDRYDEVVLASPVWAFTTIPFIKKFLKQHRFKNKKVTLLITHEGGPGKALEGLKRRIDKSNEIIQEYSFKFSGRYDKNDGEYIRKKS